jgi:predicted alpha-1,2-mannosidase
MMADSKQTGILPEHHGLINMYNWHNMKPYFTAALLALQLPLAAQKLTRYVDPFLGTGGHGHTYPGATVPFGMVQLSPDNGAEGWDWSSGYHYSSDSIAGFSHTHLSGTGIGDWCDISVLPLTDVSLAGNEQIKIPFSHKNERAKPGLYQVQLGNGVQCNLTATERCGYHQYVFPGKNAWLQFDMGFRINWDKSTAGMLQLLNDSTLIGYRYSTGWAKNQRVYFAARFSKRVSNTHFVNTHKNEFQQDTGTLAKALLQFTLAGGEPLEVKVGISSVSTEKALLAVAETNGKSFETVAAMADAKWEQELSKIKITSTDEKLKQRFYTALYHTCLAPVIQSDADGEYKTHDGKQQKFTSGKNKYTVFSQWDVFRALNPLFTITQPKRLPDMINSMLQLYRDNGLLPVWDLSTWEANTMTGYHSIPIIADAMLKNIKGFDYSEAYTAMRKSAFQNQRGTPDYIKYGYLPQDKHGWSVTITLEYAYDDWCIAQVAKKLGRLDDYKLFMQRALSYQPLFDKASGFMRAKDSNGKFMEPFDPLMSEHGFDGQYVEGTAWQHSFFVPHDVKGLAGLYGGKAMLAKKLDELFSAESVLHGENVSMDVSGLIGQYAHGNEPSHHIIYMYTALGYPAKAAEKIKLVTDSLYKNGPEGLSGNDDCGQMSAWYVWTALGMYPMNPAGGEYVFGYPLIDKATLQLPNKKQLHIRVTRRRGNQAPGIASVQLNGRALPVRSLTHAQLLQGGVLVMVVNE